jgi:8-oxo-dGTP pyrophosphatase MutT (NUDIX family)
MLEQKDLHKTIKDLLSNRPHKSVDDRNSFYAHAAVLIPLFREDGEYKVLFTKRTDRVEHHKGQISFPGGAVDEEDGSLVETALREAYEEVGLLREDVRILGRIDDRLTVASNFVIHPFVGTIPHPYDFRINAKEVKNLVEVPLKIFFPDGSTDNMHDVEYAGITYQSVAFPYQGEVIWGATAKIMENLVEILEENLNLSVEEE